MCDAVVCIMAYSIKCKASVSYIAFTMSSIAHQSVPLDGLYISMYNEIDRSVVKSSVEEVLGESNLNYEFDSHTHIYALGVTYAAPPFVQYKQLLEYMKEKKFCYVINLVLQQSRSYFFFPVDFFLPPLLLRFCLRTFSLQRLNLASLDALMFFMLPLPVSPSASLQIPYSLFLALRFLL